MPSLEEFKTFTRNIARKKNGSAYNNATISTYCAALGGTCITSAVCRIFSGKNSIFQITSCEDVDIILKDNQFKSTNNAHHRSPSAALSIYKRYITWINNGRTVSNTLPPAQSIPSSSQTQNLGNNTTPTMGLNGQTIKKLIDDFYKDVELSGLTFDRLTIERFVTSLLTKPFVILSGLAGSGKTRLAIAFAKWISENLEGESNQVSIVPVGADWTNREPMLGYRNALEENKYVLPESGVLDLIMAANN